MISTARQRLAPSARRRPAVARRTASARAERADGFPDWAAILETVAVARWSGRAEPFAIDRVDPPRPAFLAPCARPGWPGTWLEAVAASERPRLQRFFAGCRPGMKPACIEYALSAGRRRPVWVRHWVTAARPGPDGSVALEGAVCGLGEVRRLQEELLRISEREQNRIGQDLHDDLCQVLAGLSCLTRVAEKRIGSHLPGELENLREINRQLVEAMDRTRALTHGLFPSRNRIADVRGALEELGRQARVRFGLDVRTRFQGSVPRHAPEQIVHVFRIAQEAVTNAVRHGRARRVEIALEASESAVSVTVRDNGCGFDPTERPASAGIGTEVMHHRAAFLRGALEIESRPGRGTSVHLRYQPVSP